MVELGATPNIGCSPGISLFNSYFARFDPYGMYNGTDVTVPADGWWIISADQQWEEPIGIETGFSLCGLWLNGGWIHSHCWRWDFPNRTLWPFEFPFGTFGYNTMTWQGLLHKGDRFRVQSHNGTFFNPHHILTGNLKAAWLRSAAPTAFITG